MSRSLGGALRPLARLAEQVDRMAQVTWRVPVDVNQRAIRLRREVDVQVMGAYVAQVVLGVERAHAATRAKQAHAGQRARGDVIRSIVFVLPRHAEILIEILIGIRQGARVKETIPVEQAVGPFVVQPKAGLAV
jgi:hypothetical protein